MSLSVTEANKIKVAIGHIMKGFEELAAAVDEASWESFEDHHYASGPRPIDSPRVEEPSIHAAWEEMAEAEAATMNAAVSTPEPQPAPTVTLEQVRAVLVEVSQAGLREQVHQLILDCGAESLSQVDPAQYPVLLAKTEELRNA